MPVSRVRLDTWFLLLPGVALCTGTTLGILMGALQNFSIRPVHAHLNLHGWVSLALFGLFYRAYPELARGRLSRAHLILSGSSALVVPLGFWLEQSGGGHVVVGAGALLWLAATILFLLNVLKLSRSGDGS